MNESRTSCVTRLQEAEPPSPPNSRRSASGSWITGAKRSRPSGMSGWARTPAWRSSTEQILPFLNNPCTGYSFRRSFRFSSFSTASGTAPKSLLTSQGTPDPDNDTGSCPHKLCHQRFLPYYLENKPAGLFNTLVGFLGVGENSRWVFGGRHLGGVCRRMNG
jgi:hypothetical protein